MKYRFELIENGQIAEGYTVIQVINHEAEIANDDAETILLAEKHGGELVAKAKVPDKARMIKDEPEKGDSKQ